MISKSTLSRLLAPVVIAGLCLSQLASAAPILKDGFEDSAFWNQWTKCGTSGARMELDERNAHSGVHSALAQPNWKYPYTLCHVLPAAYTGNIYFSAWVYDDCVIPPGLPGPADNPNWTNEHIPNALIRLDDSNSFDYLHLGTIGKPKSSTNPQYPQNIFFSVDTKADGVKMLSGAPVSVVPARREPGWRKWMIRVKPYTGTKGDVEFYLDGQLVYQGLRSTGPGGAASLDTVGLGSDIWTAEWYWYDDVEFDAWPTPVPAVDIPNALNNPDDTCVELDNMVVDKVYADFITVADGAGNKLDVYPARFEAPGDVVNVVGKLATSDGRYIDSLTVTVVAPTAQVAATSIAQARAFPDGTRIKLPERVVTASMAATRFIEEANRTSGLKIRNIYEPLIGDKVVIEGQIMTDGTERLFEAEKVTITTHNNTLPKPVGVTNKALYNSNLSPNGMLVVTTGKVVNRPGSGTWYPAWCEIRDGSQSPDDPPIRIQLPHYSTCPQIGDYVWVKGAAGMLVESTGVRPRIYCNNLTDIRVVQAAQ